jgi:hypothetical protein
MNSAPAVTPADLSSGNNLNPSLNSFTSIRPFPFLSFPPEIRNLIYQWTFTLSRRLAPEYNIPDFTIHGHKTPSDTYGGIRWENIPSFNLLLANKQIFLEALPVISAESYMEIKIYTDEKHPRREKKAWAAYSTLLRTKALCQNVRKIVLNLTPPDTDVEFSYDVGVTDPQIVRLGALFQIYSKLRELTLVIHTGSLCMDRWNWEVLGENFFVLARKKGKGISLCVELVDWEVNPDDSEVSDDEVEDVKHERGYAEKMFDSMVSQYAGKGAEVSHFHIIRRSLVLSDCRSGWSGTICPTRKSTDISCAWCFSILVLPR